MYTNKRFSSLLLSKDVSPHLIFKNGPHPTLWPQDVPFPGDETDTKNDITGYQDDGSQGTPESRACFSPDGNGGMHYPSYFKDGKGKCEFLYNKSLLRNHELTQCHLNFDVGQKLLPDVIQNGRAVGMPLYVRCPICDKEFKQKTTLLQHGCIHIESRPYPCPECGKRFRQQSHLTQHLRIHTNEKPFGCLYCPRFFRQRTILNQVSSHIEMIWDRFSKRCYIFSTFEFILVRNRTNVHNAAKISDRRRY